MQLEHENTRLDVLLREVTYGDNGKENGNYYMVYGCYVGMMEKKMETTI